MTPLNDVVLNYMTSRGLETKHGMHKYRMMAVEGLRQIAWDAGGGGSGMPKEVKLLVDKETMSVNLPPDYIKKLAVGIMLPNGQLLSLIENNNLSILDRTMCQADSMIPNYVGDWENAVDVAGSFSAGQYIGRDFGVGAQTFVGEYREYNGQLLLNPYYQFSHVIVRYISQLQKISGQYLVHPYLELPLQYYIDYKDIAFSPMVSANEKMFKKKQFGNALREAIQRFNTFTVEEAIHNSNKRFVGSPKF